MREGDNPAPLTHTQLTIQEVYVEIGVNYRYFLTWRQRIFAGYLAVLGALSVAGGWMLKDAPQFLWLFPVTGLLLTLVFWILERRNRELYGVCINRGAACEAGLGDMGVYSGIRQRPQRVTQSAALDLLFAGAAIAFVAAGLMMTLFPATLR
jgi:hypothetical protein